MAALDELSLAWATARDDERFRAELDGLLRDFVGRPTPLYLAERLSERVGRRVYLKREDLAHTGAHKINNAVGQALLAKRMGKTRVIAETGAGQHGVASATACALLGLECVVYMGTEDMRRQAPNVERMRLLGAEVAPVEAGARTLKEAVSAAIRDWVTNVATTHYIIGSAVGPAPYPALVRDLQLVIGARGARAGAGRRGRPAVAGDRLRRRRLERDRHLRPVRRRRAGRADRGRGGGGGGRQRPHRRLADRWAGPGSCTERSPRCSPTPTARSSRRIRSPPGSTTRGSGPSTPTSATAAGFATSRSPTTRPCAPSASSPGSRASSRRSSQATPIAWLLENSHATANQGRATSSASPAGVRGSGEGRDYDVLTLCGRGDKDLAEVVERLGDG